MDGLRLATSFGLAPNRLGYCGTQISKKQKILREFVYTGKKEQETRKIISGFEGAYNYYCLIARKNGIKDPLNKKVVEAYWIGNKLLEKVSGEDIKKMILKRFAVPGLLDRAEAEERIKKISSKAKPHHSFHVFILGTVTGKIDLNTTKLKDVCRVGWGKVLELENRGSKPKAIVAYKPIVKGYKFGKEKKIEIRWDKKIIPELKIGDWVAFHWREVSMVLTGENIKNLEKYTLNSLKQL